MIKINKLTGGNEMKLIKFEHSVNFVDENNNFIGFEIMNRYRDDVYHDATSFWFVSSTSCKLKTIESKIFDVIHEEDREKFINIDFETYSIGTSSEDLFLEDWLFSSDETILTKIRKAKGSDNGTTLYRKKIMKPNGMENTILNHRKQ